MVAGCGQTAVSPPAAVSDAREGLPVEVVRIAPRNLSRQISVSAPVEPLRHIELACQIAGVITMLEVEAGDRVEKGEVLATLDVRETRAELARGRAQLREQEVNLERLEKLRERNYIDEASLSIAKTELAVAQADVGLWETRVSFGTVRSPISGIVTARYFEPGEAIAQHAPLLALADFSQLVVRFGLSELDVAGLDAGDAVPVTIDALGPNVTLPGTLRRIMPTTESASRLVTIEVALPDSDRAPLRLGYLARTTLVVDQRDDVLAVPISSVGLRAGGSYVMVVNDENKLQQQDVEVGVSRGNWREITSGLTIGDAVVTSSPADLTAGEPVRIVRELDASA
jgi:RND family efflux transporter MFP subunit